MFTKDKNVKQFEKVKSIFKRAAEVPERPDAETGLSWNEMSEALVYTPEKLSDLYIKLAPEPFDGLPHSAADIKVVNADSFEAALSFRDTKCLVLNFSNAFTPGGGVENGASTQEESLCRCSSLYASITSEKASEVYKNNNEEAEKNRPETDAIIISPKVSVFCNRKFDKLPKPFVTAVMTCPAVDRSFSFRKLFGSDSKKAAETMRRRVRFMLSAAADGGYKDLILGAWGCGDFGNSPVDVAGYFHEVLVEEGFVNYFDHVIFAVLCKKPESDENYSAFNTVFSRKYIGFCEKDKPNGYLSSSFHSEFSENGLKFSSADQYFFYRKAKLFDENNAAEILTTEDTDEMRKICRKFKNYDERRWNCLRILVMHQALILKFSQNDVLRKKLLDTEDSMIVNCDSDDRIWGIGIPADDGKRFIPDKYMGYNYLGSCLEFVREELKKAE